MLKSLILLVVLANLFISVSCGKFTANSTASAKSVAVIKDEGKNGKETLVTVNSTATAKNVAAASGNGGKAVVGSSSSASSSIIVKTNKVTQCCTSCGCDKNATRGCGINCGRRCSNYDKGPVICADECYVNSCDCKKGYVFDDFRGFCVKPKDCSNRNPPDPKGTEGEPGDGEVKEENTDPCDDCDERNCDIPEPTRPDGGEVTCSTEKDNTTSSTSAGDSTTQPGPNCEDEAYKLFRNGTLNYSIKLLIEESKRNPNKNVLIGGTSILLLLSEPTLEATGSLKVELLKVLNFKETDQMCRCSGKDGLSYEITEVFPQDIVLEQIRCFMPKLIANLTAKYPVTEYNLFCKIYADKKHALSNDFINRTSKFYSIVPENIDFCSTEAVEKINSDVAKNTNNLYPEFMEPYSLTSLNGLILVDAAALQGKWEKLFNPAETRSKAFHCQGRVEKIPMMHQTDEFKFAESDKLDAKLLELIYNGGNFSLAILVPNKLDGIKEMMKKMQNFAYVLSMFDDLKFEKVDVYLPKFEISVTNRLKMSSEMAGLKEIFNNATSGLKDIGSAKPPFVSEILQKLTYQVDESGMGNKSCIDFPDGNDTLMADMKIKKKIVKANRPFVYFVSYQKIVLFVGLFLHP